MGIAENNTASNTDKTWKLLVDTNKKLDLLLAELKALNERIARMPLPG